MAWFGGARRSPGPSRLRVGDVVFAQITPNAGASKFRRSVVLAVDFADANDPLRRILVVGVTSDNGRYNADDVATYPPLMFVEMPFHPDGRCKSSFNRPCAAKADWIEAFRRDELEDRRSGYLTTAEVDALIARIGAFDDAQRAGNGG